MCIKTENKEIIVNEIVKDTEELFEILSDSKQKEKLLEYKIVRLNGKYNMLDEKARRLTGLTQKDYIYIIEHYKELMKKYPDVTSLAISRLDYIKSANIAKIIALKGCDNCIETVFKKLDVKEIDLCEDCKNIIEPYTSQIINVNI